MSENNRYYWLKLKNDFFNQKEIKKLRKIAGGDTYTIIYLKMLLMSISNSGVIYYDGHEENLIEQISLTIDEDIDNVRITMLFLEKHDLIETYGMDIKLPEAISSIGSETQSTIRSRKHRELKALHCNTNATDRQQSATPLKQSATKCNTEIDIELEKEINSNAQSPAPMCEEKLSKTDLLKKQAEELFDYYLETFKSLGKHPKKTQDKINKIISRLKEFSFAELKQTIDLCRANSYICGDNPKQNFYATVEYIFRSFAQTEKILERSSVVKIPEFSEEEFLKLTQQEFICRIKKYFKNYNIGAALGEIGQKLNGVGDTRKKIWNWHLANSQV